MLETINKILGRLSMNVCGHEFGIHAYYDKTYGSRIYLQIRYMSPCTKTREMDLWTGRKWYLSSHMTEDEIIKTSYAAFKAAVEHEIMEGFKVDGKILFNPHVSYQELLKISDKEVKREMQEG